MKNGLIFDRLCMLSRRHQRRLRKLLSLTIAALVVNLTLPTPTPTLAAAETKAPKTSLATLTPVINPSTTTLVLPSLPSVPDKPRPAAKRQLVIRSSAYSSTPDQTDGDPFTTASGSKVHRGTVATNCLAFGTKIRIPDYFGDEIFTVEDRMHPKWGCGKIDIWMTSRAEAKQWGVRRVQIEII